MLRKSMCIWREIKDIKALHFGKISCVSATLIFRFLELCSHREIIKEFEIFKNAVAPSLLFVFQVDGGWCHNKKIENSCLRYPLCFLFCMNHLNSNKDRAPFGNFSLVYPAYLFSRNL